MNENRGHRIPKWLMILCIGALILGLAAWLLIPGSSNSIVKLLPYSLFLLCPLSHFLMMPLMHRSQRHLHGADQVDEDGHKQEKSCH